MSGRGQLDYYNYNACLYISYNFFIKLHYTHVVSQSEMLSLIPHSVVMKTALYHWDDIQEFTLKG